MKSFAILFFFILIFTPPIPYFKVLASLEQATLSSTLMIFYFICPINLNFSPE